MNFNYKMPTEKFGNTIVDRIGDYTGPETKNIMLNQERKIDSKGTIPFTLQSSNPQHIIIMDIFAGSLWFDFDNTPEIVEQVGPYINLKTETSFSPKSHYDIDESIINEDGTVDFVYLAPFQEVGDILRDAQQLKNDCLENIDLASEVMVVKYTKLIVICDWLLYEWDQSVIPAHKIIIPTLETINDFNDVV